MSRKKLTVHDYLQCKGKRQLSVMFVHNAYEAAAAEEAGIDMICTSHDAPQYGIYNSFDELKRKNIYISKSFKEKILEGFNKGLLEKDTVKATSQGYKFLNDTVNIFS